MESQKNDPASYRPKSLIPTFCKVFEKLITNRIQSCSLFRRVHFPCSQQQGFQKGLTTAFCLQETIYDIADLHSKIFVAFLDFKAAFDSVWHNALFLKLNKLGITGKVWRIIRNSYIHLKCYVIINGQKSGPVPIKRGVRQGGVASTLYYLVYIDELLRDLEQSESSPPINANCAG